MSWNLKNDRPIYSQLLEHIKLSIISGYYPAGSKLPSVRDLAAEASVNPNTMQKALSELERTGILYSQRTAGRFITEDENMIRDLKRQIAQEEIESFLKSMKNIGINGNEAMELIQSYLEKEKES